MRKIAVFLIKIYQLLISPILISSCKFQPTCSEYAIEAYKKYGFIKGTFKSFHRLLICHPFNKKNGYHPLK